MPAAVSVHELARLVRFGLAGIICCCWSPVVGAELELKSISPLGGTRGTSTELTVEGNGFDQACELYCSSPGMVAEQIAKNRFRVAISRAAPLGDCELWLGTPAGLVGPRRFAVGALPTLQEQAKHASSQSAQLLPVPSVVDARLEPFDLDWYAFAGETGQVVTVSARSRSLDCIAQPVFTLLSPDGLELAHSPAYMPEPTLTLRLFDSGVYRLLVRERAYRGGDAGGYRLSVLAGARVQGATPHAIGAAELESPAGPAITLLGIDLPGGKPCGESELLQELTLPLNELRPASPPANVFDSVGAYGLSGLRLRADGFLGGARVGISPEPVVSELAGAQSPQPISWPCRVAGRFQSRNDFDMFRFAASKDDVLWIEAFGERLDQWMDLEITIHQADGKELKVFQDLAAPKGVPAQLPLASLDPAGSWKVPADGEYDLIIRDLYGGSVYGADRRYQLVLRRTAPSFGVIAMSTGGPSSGVSVSRGDSGELQLIAIRREGFQGPIQLRAMCPHESISLAPALISPQDVTCTVQLNVGVDSALGIWPLRLVAEAEFGTGRRSIDVRGAAQVRPGTTRLTDGVVLQIRK